MRYFRIRLGHENYLFEDGYRKDYVGVNYDIKEDLTSLLVGPESEVESRIKEVYKRYHPDDSANTVGQNCGTIERCCHDMSEGDWVLAKAPNNTFHLTKVTGGYSWQPDSELPHQRPVEWTGIAIAKDQMDESLSNSIDSPGTCIEIDRDLESLKALIAKAEQWKDRLQPWISKYEEQFDAIAPQERYKWEAIHHFQQHWDLEAPDFSSMLERAWEKSHNLLNASRYFPKGMMTSFSSSDPETVRSAFRWLYHEDGVLEERMEDFQRYARALRSQYNPDDKQDYQHARAQSVYLTFRYPEQYAFFMPSVFENASKRLGFPTPPKHGEMGNLRKWMCMLRNIASILGQPKHAPLVDRHRARLDENCHRDESLLILAQDLVFAMKYHLS